MKYTQEYLKKNLKVGQIWVDSLGVEIGINQVMVDDRKSFVGDRDIVKFEFDYIGDYKTTYVALIEDLDDFTYTGRFVFNDWKIEDINDMIEKIKANLE